MTETPTEPRPKSAWRRVVGRTAGAIVLVAVALAAYGIWHSHHNALADHSARVAQEANAYSCTDTGFYLTSKLDGSKQVIYDCSFGGSSSKCVTEAGGLATDATEEVQLLFADTLGSQKPSCITH